MAIKSVLVLLLVVFAVTTTSGLECYECGKTNMPSCADPPSQVGSCPSGDNKTYVCLTRSKLSDGTTNKRGCAELTDGVPLGCTDYETLGLKECLCTENKCNSEYVCTDSKCNNAASLVLNGLVSLVPVVLSIKHYF